MSFIQDEINKIEKALQDEQIRTIKGFELQAAWQALEWALDPTGRAKSPYNTIMQIYDDPGNGLIRATVTPWVTSPSEQANNESK